LLVSPFENATVGALYAHSTVNPISQPPSKAGEGQYGWEKASTTYGTVSESTKIYGITAPLDIDGSVHRYVRMKIRVFVNQQQIHRSLLAVLIGDQH